MAELLTKGGRGASAVQAAPQLHVRRACTPLSGVMYHVIDYTCRQKGDHMPNRDADGFGAVRFRERAATRAQQSPTLFAFGATAFLAVLLALCAHSLIVWSIAALAPEPTAQDLRREMQKWEGIWEQSIPAPPSTAPAPSAPAVARPGDRSPRAIPLPQFPGLIEAQRGGHDIACLSGRVSYRIPNGWSSSNRPCRATTQ